MKRPFFVLAGALILVGIAPSALLGQDTKPPATPHELEGREQCLMCHTGAMQGVAGVPADHEGRENNTCQWCHAADAALQTTTPTAISHDLEGRDQCLMCHSGAMQGMPAAPESHEGRENNSCQWCHKSG
jgi:hypothetical protein